MSLDIFVVYDILLCKEKYMRNYSLLVVVVAVAMTLGCAASPKCPVVEPKSACEVCSAQLQEKTKDNLTVAVVVASNGIDTVLEFLQASEKYMAEKIEGWKKNHPELVEAAQKKLDSIREQIREYKGKLAL